MSHLLFDWTTNPPRQVLNSDLLRKVQREWPQRKFRQIVKMLRCAWHRCFDHRSHDKHQQLYDGLAAGYLKAGHWERNKMVPAMDGSVERDTARRMINLKIPGLMTGPEDSWPGVRP
jgi:hypothetical protein